MGDWPDRTGSREWWETDLVELYLVSDEDRSTVRIVQCVDPYKSEHPLPPVLQRYHNERSLALLNVQIKCLDQLTIRCNYITRKTVSLFASISLQYKWTNRLLEFNPWCEAITKSLNQRNTVAFTGLCLWGECFTSGVLSGFQKWTPPCALTRGTWMGFPVSTQLKLHIHGCLSYLLVIITDIF